MRHLGTVLAAAIVGPLAWILFALGQTRSAQAFAAAQDGGTLDSGDFLQPALVLAAAGILLGLIGTLRFSPLGATLTGLAYSATYLGLLISPASTLRLLDHEPSLLGHRVDLAAPLRTGTTLLVGSLLLVAVVSVRRWQRWPKPADTPEAVQPDEIIPPAARDDRPLGADGLGLDLPRRTPEPELVRTGGRDATPGTDPASRSDQTGRSDWAGRSDRTGVLAGGAADRPGRPADWPRPQSR